MNVLLIKLGALGDFVLAVGMMRAIVEKVREDHPDARFTLMTGGAFLPIAEQMGVFSDYIIDNRGPYWKPGELARVMKETARGGFERIYDVQGSKRTRRKYFWLLRLLMPRSFVWTHCHYGREVHVSKKRRWSVGRLQTVPSPRLGRRTDLSFLHGKNEHFADLPERFVLLIPGCSPKHPYKRWAASRYAELARRLAMRGLHSVVIGTGDEKEAIAEIAAATPFAVNMMNKTSLLDVPDLALRAVAVVGNDTGPTHMASLAGAPTIALYDDRTRNSVTCGPRSWNMVSEGEIARIAVDEVWERLLPLLGGELQSIAPEAAAP